MIKRGAPHEVDLASLVGRHYNRFWRFRGRYRVCKGSRASKKSKTVALWFIVNMISHPGANLLVVRKVFRTLKDSCFTDLKWAMNRLGVASHFDVKESPLEMTYLLTGQKILFRGLDDPMKITSITVEVGSLCWMWIEEAYEISKESDFDMLDESVRGVLPDEHGLFKQITITLNPWNEHHWIKKRFFDAPPDQDILALTTNYTMNEFLDDADLRLFEKMKATNPRRYQVAGLGEWGIVDGLVFENWAEESFDLETIKNISGIKSAFGLDFGYTNDPTALFCGMVDLGAKRLYVFEELYRHGMSNEEIYSAVEAMGFRKERIIADSAEPKSIDRLRDLGMHNVRRARKGADSVNHGIDYLQDFEIIVHPKCVNFLTEISNYTWAEDRFGKKINKPIDGFNHLMDAMRYAVEPFSKGDTFSFG